VVPADTATPPEQQQALPEWQRGGDLEEALEPGLGDQVDTDTDGDGSLDSYDNCPCSHNPYQKDFDYDGKGMCVILLQGTIMLLILDQI
jgi:hypothetical protein